MCGEGSGLCFTITGVRRLLSCRNVHVLQCHFGASITKHVERCRDSVSRECFVAIAWERAVIHEEFARIKMRFDRLRGGVEMLGLLICKRFLLPVQALWKCGVGAGRRDIVKRSVHLVRSHVNCFNSRVFTRGKAGDNHTCNRSFHDEGSVL